MHKPVDIEALRATFLAMEEAVRTDTKYAEAFVTKWTQEMIDEELALLAEIAMWREYWERTKDADLWRVERVDPRETNAIAAEIAAKHGVEMP